MTSHFTIVVAVLSGLVACTDAPPIEPETPWDPQRTDIVTFSMAGFSGRTFEYAYLPADALLSGERIALDTGARLRVEEPTALSQSARVALEAVLANVTFGQVSRQECEHLRRAGGQLDIDGDVTSLAFGDAVYSNAPFACAYATHLSDAADALDAALDTLSPIVVENPNAEAP